MSTWEILEIEPTIEIGVIKKAYAKKLKIYHPEDDPQGYQILREAYDSALKFSKKNQKNKIESSELEENNDSLSTELVFEENYDNTIEYYNYKPPIVNKIVSCEEIVEEFFEKVNDLYNDFFNRIEEQNWKELLDDEIMWQFEYKEIINKKILVYLIDNHYLPQNIWLVLNENFHWNEQEEYLKLYYPEAFIKYIFRQISSIKVPRYCYFYKSIEIDYEEYLNYREEAFVALFENDLKKAEYLIFKAYAIYSNDPDLLCMKGEYYLKISDLKKATLAFEDAIKINPKDVQTYIYQAQIMFNNKKTGEAIKIYKYITSNMSVELEVFIIICDFYFKIGDWHNASRLLLYNLEIKPLDIETRNRLKRVANHLKKKIEKHPFKFKLRLELRKIYKALGEFDNLKKIKITFRSVLYLFGRIVYCIEVMFGAAIILGLIIGTRGILIVGIVLYRVFKKKQNK